MRSQNDKTPDEKRIRSDQQAGAQEFSAWLPNAMAFLLTLSASHAHVQLNIESLVGTIRELSGVLIPIGSFRFAPSSIASPAH
jgi:hypothetical protein